MEVEVVGRWEVGEVAVEVVAAAVAAAEAVVEVVAEVAVGVEVVGRWWGRRGWGRWWGKEAEVVGMVMTAAEGAWWEVAKVAEERGGGGGEGGGGGVVEQPGCDLEQAQVNVVMKFGGSSVATAERMREVASIACSFPDLLPCLVLSAMGKSTNNLLLAGEQALTCSKKGVPDLEPLCELKRLHRETMDELETDEQTRAEVEELLDQLQQLLVGVSIMQELTPRTRANLVSHGERMSTRIFSSYLCSQGVNSVQHDAWDIGFRTTEHDFENGEVLPEFYPAIGEALAVPEGAAKSVPVVTGFLGRGMQTGAITTLGRGGSDLSATIIGASLKVPEVQVWKDVDGVLTADPRRVSEAQAVPLLTFDEATELAYFGAQVLHPHAMRPAMDANGGLAVRVKNSYNIDAPGTLITSVREMENSILTSIVLKALRAPLFLGEELPIGTARRDHLLLGEAADELRAAQLLGSFL
ncbi:hypothetical protein CYMTET_48441 [Cymbomonas tetramitiformis]|uniref:Aspartokinase n=1 Tax=Cymbomonas tetramitiformis TaxID=36881 RepID=A0AAE0BU54_9CHLO|nr:hypothetical protein CYMTET_48441 [Cymbomonas tetramitiformis]